MKNSLGIRGYDYIEFYVGTANKWAYWFARAMGLEITGYAGPETGVKDRISFLLTKNKIKFVITGPLQPGSYDIHGFIQRHGDGTKRWSMEVDSVEDAFNYAISKGGIPIKKVTKEEDENGFITEAAVKVYDSAEIVFINRDHYKGLFRPGFGKPVHDMILTAEDSKLEIVDHIVGNVRENEMSFWIDYMNRTLDFETFIDFGPGDISTKYSALLSKVVRSSDSIIRNPVNEPYEGIKKSQIEEYIEEYAGTGIQHIAIRTENILEAIQALRKNGMEFLTVPDTYYQLLKERNIKIDENIDDLKELGILCDVEGEGYLLQIFTKPVGDRPTFFFEVIQRKYGSQGFGKGNFQALFESIEREQARRGNL